MKKDTKPNSQSFRASFHLFEQLAEAARDWDMDFRQLQSAQELFRLEQIQTASMLYSRAYLGTSFHQRGGPVTGFRTFALTTDHGSDFRWCGEPANRGSLIVFPVGGEFESISQPGFDIFTLSLSQKLLEETAESYFQRPLSDFISDQRQVCHRAGSALVRLRRQLHGLSNAFTQHSQEQDFPEGCSRTEQVLCRLVLECLNYGDLRTSLGSREKRMQLLQDSVAFIDAALPKKTNINKLASRLGISRRNLENAFRNELDLSPASYIKVARLKCLNQTLLSSSATETMIADMCSAHDFNSPGQLAQDYRSFFGELPSQTLRR